MSRFRHIPMLSAMALLLATDSYLDRPQRLPFPPLTEDPEKDPMAGKTAEDLRRIAEASEKRARKAAKWGGA